MAQEPNARDAKLIQYLNEAYGKEKQLETALQAHISLTTRPPYKKRLQEHLKETKQHAKLLERRIKKLGGTAEAGPDLPGPAETVANLAGRAVAAAQGPLHALRGTGEARLDLPSREAAERQIAAPRHEEDEACATEPCADQEASLERRRGARPCGALRRDLHDGTRTVRAPADARRALTAAESA